MLNPGWQAQAGPLGVGRQIWWGQLVFRSAQAAKQQRFY
jgi:hypothetical protein